MPFLYVGGTNDPSVNSYTISVEITDRQIHLDHLTPWLFSRVSTFTICTNKHFSIQQLLDMPQALERVAQFRQRAGQLHESNHLRAPPTRHDPDVRPYMCIVNSFMNALVPAWQTTSTCSLSVRRDTAPCRLGSPHSSPQTLQLHNLGVVYEKVDLHAHNRNRS